MNPRKHAELIKSWADGAEIQRLGASGNWIDENNPGFFNDIEYRKKPLESKKVNVGGRMVNAPITELPEVGSTYWYLGTCENSMMSSNADHVDNSILKSLSMFKSEQDAIEWRDAWLELKNQALAGKAICIHFDFVVYGLKTKDGDRT